MSDALQRFVREALGRGFAREAIREQLLKAGWRTEEVEAALKHYAESDFPVPVPRRHSSLNAREAFLYLVLFATLYTSAFNSGQVLFALIERWIPDPSQREQAWSRFGDWVRSATAGIIIAFPIYLLLSRLIGRELAREPEKRGSSVRKWLTYVTLFIAALVLIGDLTVLVTRVLAGELAPRFLLKVLAVFLIAGTVFGHYLGDLRREEGGAGAPRAATGPWARAAAGAVFLVMIGGLFLSGSPQQERRRQLDTQRVEALQRISGAIQSYHTARQRLPGSLDSLLKVPEGVSAETLIDPVSREPYEFQTLDSLSYELCAKFEAAAAGGVQSPFGSEFWTHGAGRKCFRFDVTAKVR